MVNSLYKNVLWCFFYNFFWKGSTCLDRPEYWMRTICVVRLFCQKTAELVLVTGLSGVKWSPIRFVIIRVINKIGRPRSGSPICLITCDYKPNCLFSDLGQNFCHFLPYFDHNHNYNEHVSVLICNVSKQLQVLKRHKHLISACAKKRLYDAFLFSCLSYCRII